MGNWIFSVPFCWSSWKMIKEIVQLDNKYSIDKGDAFMTMIEEMILSGFISKVVNELVDIPGNPIKNAIENADKNRKDKNQSIETRIYQVIIDSINKFTNDKYKDQDALYDVAERIIRGFKKSNNNTEAVRAGLKMLVSQVTSDTCEDFLTVLHHEICIDKNDILYKEIILLQGEQTFEAVYKGFDVSKRNDEETHKKLDYVIEGINYIDKRIDGIENYETKHNAMFIKNRADEYFEKWDKNVFLNDFNEEDENAGVNIKLKDLYRDECLPHYIWKKNSQSSDKLKNLLKKYVIDNNDKKMLLILGQAGIGKSTLITWIMANLVEKKDDILIYQFANDLGSINWQGENVLNDIFNVIGLEYDEFENKTLILDGFDEIYAGGERERILNKLDQELKRRNILKKFSLIITCRENYIYNLQNIECDYITLQIWDETQISIFSRAYWEKCGNESSEDEIQRILENKEIFGIPLILYMILALDVDIEKAGSKMDIYDQVFSLKRGGIYDRCYDTEHRINSPDIKRHIHRISQKVSFWIFENNDDKADISQEIFKEICDNEMNKSEDEGEEIQSDTLIGNFYKLKHCEGQGTDELQFVHRSIYEYFVAIYFYESIHSLKSKEEIAGKLGELLKDGHLSEQMLEFIKYKFASIKRYNLADVTRDIFNMMLSDGMTYYFIKEQKKPLLNILNREMNIFANMLEVVHLWNHALGEIHERIITYLEYNKRSELNLDGIKLNGKIHLITLWRIYLQGASLDKADLQGVSLIGADLLLAYLGGSHLENACLKGVCLKGANLERADLKNVDLSEADLERAYLVGADLSGAEFINAKFSATILDEQQVVLLQDRYDLNDSRVYVSETEEVITYKEYCNMHRK